MRRLWGLWGRVPVGAVLDRITREGLAMAVGGLACILAGLSAILEVPSASASYIDGNESLVIIHHTWGYATLLNGMTLAFGVLALAALAFGVTKAARLRYVAMALLFALVTLPQILMMTRADIVRDAHLTFHSVDLVIEDMEANFNLQQVDWRRWQDFSKTFSRAIGAVLSVPIVEIVTPLDVSWTTVHEIIIVNMGVTRTTMNTFRAGFYLALAGVVCWLMGAYSGDPDASRRRTLDRWRMPLFVLVGLAVLQAIRLDSHGLAEEAKNLAARGQYEQAHAAYAQALFRNPGARYDSELNEIGALRARNLLCADCWEAILEEGVIRVERQGDFDMMVLLLTMSEDRWADHPAYDYWVGAYRTLAGMQKFNRGQISAADREFRLALDAVPTDALAWYARAIVQNRMGNHARAAHYLENALRVQKEVNFKRLTLEAQLYLMQSWDRFRDGDLIAAHQLYNLSLNPDIWE